MSTSTVTNARSNEAPRNEHENALFQFSEWLDSQGLMLCDDADQRTHENLVRDFIEQALRGARVLSES